jgi:hypothetical protein
VACRTLFGRREPKGEHLRRRASSGGRFGRQAKTERVETEIIEAACWCEPDERARVEARTYYHARLHWMFGELAGAELSKKPRPHAGRAARSCLPEVEVRWPDVDKGRAVARHGECSKGDRLHLVARSTLQLTSLRRTD